MDSSDLNQDLPNNLGATLLIIIGILSIPALIGLPLLLFGLAELRTREGRRTYASLRPWGQPRA